MSDAWLQVTFVVEKGRASVVEAALEGVGALSVSMMDAADSPLLEPLPGETPLWSLVEVTGLFSDDAASLTRVQGLVEAIGAHSVDEPRIERLADQVWERVWLDHFHPMRFGKRLWVVPTGQPVQDQDAVIVRLDPGLAFGTGTHPTTSLCLSWLDATRLEGCTVVDYGCGSGILGIAALKLGAATVFAIDHDPQALQATAENARTNGVGDRISIMAPGQRDDIQADITIANILSGPLIELAPLLSGMTETGGRIVLSGILDQQAEAVSKAYDRWFQMSPPALLDQWCLIEGKKVASEA